ncbi:enoyl-CoA hydratase/isomerase family protein [Chachezhania antarctica]|uniref:enoyl-CoA hydratase/isomerase family protein n=1 Tax=Chachezhania antarctica TaxID=2340860 RepID=UPI0013CEFA8E|nr:enoyl-CoA hydratase-related protein [Chachezhania antarctica]|tara:strand:- start:695 stop:1432 length:738 start_codon:yes stop_codon:yes gene_type:complete
MSDTLIETRVEDHIGWVILNRPDALNALSRALRTQMVTALDAMGADDAVRVVAIMGRGRAFCAGVDLKELSVSTESVSVSDADIDTAAALARLAKPTIAAVNGLAVTGGFELVLNCDMALAARSAWFCDTHGKVGLLPGWGLSQRLPRLIGPHRAKEISLTARRVTAEEADRLGFINRVVEDDALVAEVTALAQSIAAFDPDTIAGLKHQIDEGYGMNMADALVYEREASRRANGQRTVAKDILG